jgi:hypothetical protein
MDRGQTWRRNSVRFRPNPATYSEREDRRSLPSGLPYVLPVEIMVQIEPNREYSRSTDWPTSTTAPSSLSTSTRHSSSRGGLVLGAFGIRRGPSIPSCKSS